MFAEAGRGELPEFPTIELYQHTGVDASLQVSLLQFQSALCCSALLSPVVCAALHSLTPLRCGSALLSAIRPVVRSTMCGHAFRSLGHRHLGMQKPGVT